MKNTIITTLLLALSVIAKAYHVDSTANCTYVNVQPVTWNISKPQVQRIYIPYVLNDNLISNAVVSVQLKGVVQIDAETFNYPIIETIRVVLTPSEYAEWLNEGKDIDALYDTVLEKIEQSIQTESITLTITE